MITASNISLSYGTQVLFKEVNIKFTPGNCYGIIGANGAGKSTFLKILSGEIEPDTGEVIVTPGERMTVLRQDHFAFNDYRVIDTVIMGHQKLYDVMQERDAIYSKEDFSEEDGIKAAELLLDHIASKQSARVQVKLGFELGGCRTLVSARGAHARGQGPSCGA